MRWQTGLGEEQLMNALKATTILAALLVSGATVAHAGSIGTVTYNGYTVNPNYTATIVTSNINEAGLSVVTLPRCPGIAGTVPLSQRPESLAARNHGIFKRTPALNPRRRLFEV